MPQTKEEKRAADREYNHAHYEQQRAWKQDHAEEIQNYMKTYYQTHREHLAIQEKTWRETHREQAAASRRAYYETHKEQQDTCRKAWYESHKDHVIMQSKKWQQQYPEAKKEIRRRWALLHPESLRLRDHRHRTRKLAAFIENVDIMVLYERDKGQCGICHHKVVPKEISLDHILPLAVGGEHSYRNSQIAHRVCNSKKRDRAAIPQQLRIL